MDVSYNSTMSIRATYIPSPAINLPLHLVFVSFAYRQDFRQNFHWTNLQIDAHHRKRRTNPRLLLNPEYLKSMRMTCTIPLSIARRSFQS